MKKIILKGCGTALVTPFFGREVDYEAYAALVRRQVTGGADFLVALATTAEAPALTSEEKVELLKITHRYGGDLPVVVGCGSNSPRATLDNMALLEPYGADAWLVVVPYYNKPTQEGQYLYFKAVAEAAGKPVVIYNVPGRTGANMEAGTCLRLARDVSNIVAVKEASGDTEQIRRIIEGAPEGFSVLSGDDALTLKLMEMGAKGVVSVVSNVFPDKVSGMCAAALTGDFSAAAAIDDNLSEFCRCCFAETNPIPVKAALAHLGLMTAEVRLPLTEATASTKALVAHTLSLYPDGSQD
ncbi:MAG: 4-hydroxy-tetrahydrodipicolinate synthase [Bacteroidales bacterium]|nr:4-hydroxy-tetrahydrodipicolinate synthase [Bacteroidales bacterium]